MLEQATSFYLIVGVLIGGLSGYLLTRLYCKKILQAQKILQNKLKQTEVAYRSHQEQVTQHFTQTASLFNQITANYQNLYQHLAQGAEALCSVEKPIEFLGTAPELLTQTQVNGEVESDQAGAEPAQTGVEPAQAGAEPAQAGAENDTSESSSAPELQKDRPPKDYMDK